MIAKESDKIQEAEKEIDALTKKMRGFDQNYLELAVGYLDEGMLAEAEDVLIRFKGENPIFQYYLGHIQHKKGNKERAKKYFKTGQEMSEDYCFPYRLETVNVLKTALDYNENDGKAYYYLGNILYDKQPEKGIEYWEKAVKAEPGLAIAHRNLGWGYYRHYNDYEKAISFYEKAISLNNKEAIYYSELDVLYEKNNSPVEKRLELFDGRNEIVRNRDDAFVRQITVLTLAGQPEKSVEYLAGKNFSYREGNSRVREVIIDAQLELGLKYFAEKNYSKALEHFLLAQIPDEEAGSARSGNRDIQINYFIGLAHEALKNSAKAKSFFKLAAVEASGRRGFMSYYQGLGYLKLNDKTKANEIFTALVENGNKQLNPVAGDESDFFAIFGERDDENTRKSMAYTLRGLGYKGLGKTDLALEDLQKAVEFSVNNLWANTELKGL